MISSKKRISLFLCVCIALLGALASASEPVVNYRQVFSPFYGGAKELKIAVRRFERGAKEEYLTVDPFSFETALMDAGGIDFSGDISVAEWRETPFVKALYRYTAPANGVLNQGMKEGEPGVSGLFLTIDLCPSARRFDRRLFEAVMGLPGLKDTPAPIAVAVSGLWIERHDDELGWVLEQVKSGRLDVTWVNHSFSHPYEGSKPVEEDFMLAPGIDFEKEALAAEALMIEKGVTPSPFFRFPGLVSDSALLERLRGLSLIPIGANAWIAKGEEPKDGSFILVHGNGNEPRGIKGLLSFFKKRRSEFHAGGLRLLPLRDAFSK